MVEPCELALDTNCNICRENARQSGRLSYGIVLLLYNDLTCYNYNTKLLQMIFFFLNLAKNGIYANQQRILKELICVEGSQGTTKRIKSYYGWPQVQLHPTHQRQSPWVCMCLKSGTLGLYVP